MARVTGLPSAAAALSQRADAPRGATPRDVQLLVLAEILMFTLGALGPGEGLFGRLDGDEYWVFKANRAGSALSAVMTLVLLERTTRALNPDGFPRLPWPGAFAGRLALSVLGWFGAVGLAGWALDADMLGYGPMAAVFNQWCWGAAWLALVWVMTLPALPVLYLAGRRSVRRSWWLALAAPLVVAPVHAALWWWLSRPA